MELSSYPACFSGFSSFVEQRSCQILRFKVEPVCDHWTSPLVAHVLKARVGQGSLLSGMSIGQRKMLDTHRSRGTSALNLPTGFKSPGASTSARRSKVQKFKSLV
jgi:hypothetical protein